MNSISDSFQVRMHLSIANKQALRLAYMEPFSELVMWLCRSIARLLHLRAGLYFISSNFALPTFHFHATRRSTQLVYNRIVTKECNEKHL